MLQKAKQEEERKRREEQQRRIDEARRRAKAAPISLEAASVTEQAGELGPGSRRRQVRGEENMARCGRRMSRRETFFTDWEQDLLLPAMPSWREERLLLSRRTGAENCSWPARGGSSSRIWLRRRRKRRRRRRLIFKSADLTDIALASAAGLVVTTAVVRSAREEEDSNDGRPRWTLQSRKGSVKWRRGGGYWRRRTSPESQSQDGSALEETEEGGLSVEEEGSGQVRIFCCG
eukprot:757317-Hanusia_phi.AAC.2